MPLILKFFTKDPHEKRKREFQKHEKKVAGMFGGVQTIGSGNKGMKGDVFAGNPDAGQRLMIEAKGTKNDSIVVKVTWLNKLCKEAVEANMEPLLTIRIRDKQNGYLDYGVLPADRYVELDHQKPKTWPIFVCAGRGQLLTSQWLQERCTDTSVGYFSINCPRRITTPYVWVVIPLERLRNLYTAESASKS